MSNSAIIGVQSSLTESCNSASLTENDRPELHTKTVVKRQVSGGVLEQNRNEEAQGQQRGDVIRICHTLAENAQDSVDVSLQVWRESIDVFRHLPLGCGRREEILPCKPSFRVESIVDVDNTTRRGVHYISNRALLIVLLNVRTSISSRQVLTNESRPYARAWPRAKTH
jgi:hypothetical protein